VNKLIKKKKKIETKTKIEKFNEAKEI